MAGVCTRTGITIRYLGLTLDGRWTFIHHFQTLIPKVNGAVGALTRLLPNLGGPCEAVRKLYVSVVHSILLYGAPVWADEL